MSPPPSATHSFIPPPRCLTPAQEGGSEEQKLNHSIAKTADGVALSAVFDWYLIGENHSFYPAACLFAEFPYAPDRALLFHSESFLELAYANFCFYGKAAVSSSLPTDLFRKIGKDRLESGVMVPPQKVDVLFGILPAHAVADDLEDALKIGGRHDGVVQ